MEFMDVALHPYATKSSMLLTVNATSMTWKILRYTKIFIIFLGEISYQLEYYQRSSCNICPEPLLWIFIAMRLCVSMVTVCL